MVSRIFPSAGILTVWLLLLVGVFRTVHSQTWVLERRPDGIPASDASGTPYAIPFGGGLNGPRFQFADIDGDLDLDLFIQEKPDEFAFYRNTGSRQEPLFTWITDQFEGIASGSWFRFEDIDQDNDLDLFTEKPFNQVSFYLNTGSATNPVFELKAASLLDSDGRPVESEVGTIPAFSDMDCDGDLDYFSSKADGTITSYSLREFDIDGIPVFALDNNERKFAGIVLPDSYCAPLTMNTRPGSDPANKGETKKGSVKHGAATLTFFDANSDTMPDIFWGDAFTNGVLFFPNIGTCENPDFAYPTPTGGIGGQNDSYPDFYFPDSAPMVTSGLNFSSFADINGDGIEDFFGAPLSGFCPDNGNDPLENFYFYRGLNTGYALETKRFLTMIDVGSDASVVLHDVDGDDDLDMLIGNAESPVSAGIFGRIFLFENTGSRQNPEYRLADEDFAELSRYYFSGSGLTAYNLAPVFADIDGDMDDDMFIGFENGEITFFRNDAGSFTRISPSRYQGIFVGADAVPTFADIDGDTDLDLLIGNRNGRIAFYRNDGSVSSAQFTLVSDFFDSIDVGFRAAPALFDADGDLDMDLLVGSESGVVRYWRNDGTRNLPAFVEDVAFAFGVGESSRPAPADVDGDGDPDLIIGAQAGGLYYFENSRIVANEIVILPDQAPLQVEVWPNPAGKLDEITIKIESPESGIVVLDVYNPVGQRLLNQTLAVHQPESVFTLRDIAEPNRVLAGGVYFIQVTQGTAQRTVGLILTQE